MAYTSYQDMVYEFGETNVQKWANVEQGMTTQDLIDQVDRIADDVSSIVDDYFRGGPYLVPLTPAVPMLAKIARGLVVETLRAGRVATDDESQWLKSRIKESRDILNKVLTGEIILDCNRQPFATTVPYFVP